MRVLIVEDGATQRQALAELLRDEGHEVIEASCPDSAIEIIDDRVVDMLLVDFRLANHTAAPLIEHLRSLEDDGARPRCDVVCITGASPVEMTADGPVVGDFQRECERLGVVALFSKPVNFDRLNSLLQQRELERDDA